MNLKIANFPIKLEFESFEYVNLFSKLDLVKS